MKADYMTKIKDCVGLFDFLEEHRSKVIVQCHGCFDIVHPGHIRHLSWAKEQGDILIVTITDDRYVEKGENRPYFTANLRAEQIAALEFVECVFINHSFDACLMIEFIRPNYYVKGYEYQANITVNLQHEKDIVEACGGELIFSPSDIIFSSTELISKCKTCSGQIGW